MRIFNYTNRSPVYNKPFIQEQWKRIDSSVIPFADGPNWISNLGNIYNEDFGCIIDPIVVQRTHVNRIDVFVDYYYNDGTVFEMRRASLARTVLLAFAPIPNADKFDVNHNDSDSTNNKIYNLSWCTHKENIRFAYLNGRMTRHDKDGNLIVKSLLQQETIDKICELLLEGKNYIEIAEETNTSYNIVYSIHHGRTYKEECENYDLGSVPQPIIRESLSDTQLSEICEMLIHQIPHQEIADKIGCSKQTISSIKNGVLYPELYEKYNLGKYKIRDTTRLTKDQKKQMKVFVDDNKNNYASKNDLFRDALRFVGFDAPDKLPQDLRQFVYYNTIYKKSN